MYKYGIIGFGGLGKIHLSNLMALQKERGDIELAAICGTTLENACKLTSFNLGSVQLSESDFASCAFYDDYKEMVQNEPLDFVLSVLPSYLHAEVAVYCMEHGIDVFSEKPMALSEKDCVKMIQTSEKTGKKLVIGQCQRFCHAYRQIKHFTQSKQYGKVYRAKFIRLSQTPLWTWNNWITKRELSGGCVIDMHVHDTDLINWIFGTPKSVQSYITSNKVEYEGITSRFDYGDFSVTAEADWSFPQKFPFTAECIINYEKATVVLKNNTLTIYDDEHITEAESDAEDYFYKEIKAFVDYVTTNMMNPDLDAHSVLASMKLVMSEIQSAESKEIVYLGKQ